MGNKIITGIIFLIITATVVIDIRLNLEDMALQEEIREQEAALTEIDRVYTVKAEPARQNVTVRYVESFDAGAYLDDTYLPAEYQAYCREAADRYGLDPYILMAMVERESDGDAGAGNAEGDTGLLQVNPMWHASRMERLGVTDLKDPLSNILVAADYLHELLEQNNYNLALALMKYNMNHERADELIKNGVVSKYASSVIERAYEIRFLKEGGEANE